MTDQQMENTPRPIYLKDYRPPAYLVDTVELRFRLDEAATTVHSRLGIRLNDSATPGAPLVLNGEDLELLSLVLDNEALAPDSFRVEAETLTIFQVPAAFTLEVETRIRPGENTKLEGLYLSSGNFCTQCEAEGFRRITYFPDRSDVLARYTTTIEADRHRYPVLLANGNLIAGGPLDADRHFAVWEDPFPKPSYLFALVAGDLVCIEDAFTTRSGREILLQIYVQAHNRHKCGHAMASLQKAMAWDEAVYGLEYDLDRYMIVAVDDFNMGAMENKGLNVFNSKYVLASPATATDADFEAIEAVIAHEYFHNWTGNRVTCRDWFQLSLKEGLTVFRDQQFTADMTSAGVKRIHDVQMLRDVQFPQDNGPMAHPVRPDSYIEINNFYTVTVYEKGAELIRMLQTLLGPATFVSGVREYLHRHDGTAATTDDFVRAMEVVSGRDLTGFKSWYSQAGTPRLRVHGEYLAARQEYVLTLGQSCPPTPGQAIKAPLHIPVAVGLLGPDGREIPLRLTGEQGEAATTRVLELTGEQARFCFSDIGAAPVVSLLRGFSAPVIVEQEVSDEALRFLLVHDTEPFSRWEAGQVLAQRVLDRLIAAIVQGTELAVPAEFVDSFGTVLRDGEVADQAYLALLLGMPSEQFLAEAMAVVDVDAIHGAREFLRQTLARERRADFLAVYHANRPVGPYGYDAIAAGRRSLKNLALGYLMCLEDQEALALCLAQYRTADNMTDCIGALRPLVHGNFVAKEEVLEDFFRQWRDDPLVLDKWFAIQATAPLPETLGRVQQLVEHPAFSIRNPNRVRALIGAFAAGNPVAFHARDGAGYDFLAEQIIALDGMNPQIAARLAANFSRWRRFDPARRELMRARVERIAAKPGLSRDVYEVVAKSLA